MNEGRYRLIGSSASPYAIKLRALLVYRRIPREQALSGMSEALLGIAGELYLPFLVADAEAFAKGMKRLEINVWGLPYALSPFKYQVKCLDLLREKFAALDAEHRTALRPVLERTGCWTHLIAG
jgi:hypothetical protein